MGTAATSWALALVVGFAFATETALGFGAMVITLALGAQLVAFDELLPSLVPLNVGLSLYLAIRHRASIDRRFLARRLLPPTLVGVPLGLLAFSALPRPLMVRGFGAFVVLLACIELMRAVRRVEARSLPRGLRIALLVLGGAIHGAFATGGPVIVYVAGRELPDKNAFRATLSSLWALLGLALLVSMGAGGRFDATTSRRSLLVAVPAWAGLMIGEAVHRRVDASRFRVAVYVMLLIAGALLLRGG